MDFIERHRMEGYLKLCESLVVNIRKKNSISQSFRYETTKGCRKRKYFYILNHSKKINVN